MAEFHSRASAADQRRLFLRGYYSRPGLKYQRIIIGPLLIAVSALSYFLHLSLYYCLFILIFALYYSAKPFLMLLRFRFQNTESVVTVGDGKISIKNESGVTDFQPENLLLYHPHARYPMIKVRLGAVYYFLFDLTLFDDGPGFARALAELPMAEPAKGQNGG